MKTSVEEEKFSDFYEKWVCQLEQYLTLLHHNQSDDYQDLVTKLTAHHKEYYTVKWAAAHKDVLPFFSPGWLSPLEKSYLWITGWKPAVVFRLVYSLQVADLTEDQVRKIEVLKVKIRGEEIKVERDMERQQVALADRRMVELVRLSSGVKKGEQGVAEVDGLVEVAMKSMLAGLEKVMKMADCVRLKTLKCVLEMLTPKQSVDLLATMGLLQIQMGKLGKKRERRVPKNEQCII